MDDPPDLNVLQKHGDDLFTDSEKCSMQSEYGGDHEDHDHGFDPSKFLKDMLINHESE